MTGAATATAMAMNVAVETETQTQSTPYYTQLSVKDDTASTSPQQLHQPEISKTTTTVSPSSTIFTPGNIYKGLGANIIKEMPSSALYLGVYESLRALLFSSIPYCATHPLIVYLLAGAGGEVVGSLLRAPAEAVKTRIQSGVAPDALTAIQFTLLTKEGRESLVRSWAASVWRDVPFGGVQLAVFESVKVLVINTEGLDFDVGSLPAEALFGAMGGAIAAFMTTPADVVTTILISETGGGEAEEGAEEGSLVESGSLGRRGVWQVVIAVYNEGGIAALFTGWKERTLYWAPAIGIFLSIYCRIRQFALGVLE